MKPRPTLSVTFAKALKSAAESRGFFAYVPFMFGACLIVGFVLAELLPSFFWGDDHWGTSTAVYSGFLAFNGLLLSLGWFAFSKIYEILTNDQLGRLLTKTDLLDVHLAFIDVSHLALIFAAVVSVLGLVSTLIGMPIFIDRLLFGICVGFTFYGLARAFSATRMMNDLIWEQAHINGEPNLRSVGNNDASSANR